MSNQKLPCNQTPQNFHHQPSVRRTINRANQKHSQHLTGTGRSSQGQAGYCYPEDRCRAPGRGLCDPPEGGCTQLQLCRHVLAAHLLAGLTGVRSQNSAWSFPESSLVHSNTIYKIWSIDPTHSNMETRC